MKNKFSINTVLSLIILSFIFNSCNGEAISYNIGSSLGILLIIYVIYRLFRKSK